MPAGAVSAALAFAWWGLFPLYFRLVGPVPATQVLAHRIVWCLLVVLALLGWQRRWRWLAEVLRAPKVLGAFLVSATLIAINWSTYIWSVSNGYVVESSLGYFINPLVNVLLGMTFLHERLRRAQWIALALAGLGVAWLTVQAGRPPWIALLLAGSFGAYGLLRKIAVLGALEGLTLETLLLAPFAAGWIALQWHLGTGAFPAADLATNLWLVGLGPITAVPLLLFATGARRLSLTTLGLLQYIGPTIQFALGIWVFGEPFSWMRFVGFGLIWLALALYTADGWRRARRAAAVPA